MLRSNPKLLLRRLAERGRQNVSVPAPPAEDRVTHSLQEVVAAVRLGSPSKLVAYGDRSLVSALREALPAAVVSWVSHEAADLFEGAQPPNGAAFDSVDAVVVGGPDAALAWPSLLREVVDLPVVPSLHWVGANWEFCGSQMPLPAEIDDAEVYLFNHFPEYFQVKDLLLVWMVVADAQASIRTCRIVRPYETVRLSLAKLLSPRTGPVLIDVRTEHPVLTRGRHHRWRMCVDVHWKGSFSTLHGGHDYGSAHAVESRRPGSDLQRGSVAVVLPNPTQETGEGAVELVLPGNRRSEPVDLTRPVNQITFPESSRKGGAPTSGVYGYSYQGSGTPFWFAMGRGDTGRPILAANHELSVRIREDPVGLSGSARASHAALGDLGLLLHPHALPIPPEGASVEFGFNFRAANPAIGAFQGWLFDRSGQRLDTVTFEIDQEQPVFPRDLVGSVPHLGEAGLLVFGPDWSKVGADPAMISFGGDLVARNTDTGDVDVTEFQSCWRNLGLKVPQFPHWLHPSSAVAGRTNVLGPVRNDGCMRTAIVAVNASGTIRHTRDAVAHIRIFDPRGHRMSADVTLPSFCADVFWCDDLFDDLSASLGHGYGTVHVTSQDADLNCQLLTMNDTGAVSLQHLWGY